MGKRMGERAFSEGHFPGRLTTLVVPPTGFDREEAIDLAELWTDRVGGDVVRILTALPREHEGANSALAKKLRSLLEEENWTTGSGKNWKFAVVNVHCYWFHQGMKELPPASELEAFRVFYLYWRCSLATEKVYSARLTFDP